MGQGMGAMGRRMDGGNPGNIEMEIVCGDLLDEWMMDLTFEERQVWLWNAMVAMWKIKHAQ